LGEQALPALTCSQIEEHRARLGRALAAHWGEGKAQNILVGPEGGGCSRGAAEAVEAAGMDAGAVVSEATSQEAGGLVSVLERARFSGSDPLGPDVPLGSPTSPARAAAARAAAVAEQLVSGDATAQEPGRQTRHVDVIGLTRRPTQVDQPLRARWP
jgi:hypothetical protein